MRVADLANGVVLGGRFRWRVAILIEFFPVALGNARRVGLERGVPFIPGLIEKAQEVNLDGEAVMLLRHGKGFDPASLIDDAIELASFFEKA